MSPEHHHHTPQSTYELSRENFIDQRQFAELKSMVPLGILSSLGTATLLVFALYHEVPTKNLLTWLGFIYLVALFRWINIVPILNKFIPRLHFTTKHHIYIGHLLSGFIWGYSAILIFPTESDIHQALHTLLLGGLVAGSLGIYSQKMSVFFAFALPLLLPITLRFFLLGGLHTLLGFLLLSFLTFIISAAKKINRNHMSKLKLEYENTRLIHNLETEKDKLQESYEMMAQEVHKRKIIANELMDYKTTLEKRVQDRTSALETEIHEHKKLAGEFIKNEAKLAHQAFHDSLTDLPNRMLLKERLEQAILRCQRSGKKGALLFVDLDSFKEINDTLGHNTGDKLLVKLARRLPGYCREEDTVARLGGDEFMFILENITDGIEAKIVCDRIQEGLRKPFHIVSQELIAQVSIGITLFPDDGKDVETLMKNCDMAMYQSKENGKNCYHFFTQKMNDKLHQRINIALNLRRAIAQNEFSLYYQPKVDINRGRITGSEALIRWIQPDGSMIPPDHFIPIAESTGLIQDIDDWVLETAIQQNREWNSMGFEELNIAINISARKFQRRSFPHQLEELIKATGIRNRNVTLEITENILIEDIDRTLFIMNSLAFLGIGIALDDFGTGYSSLSYLKRFPLTILKIDKSFVDHLPEDDDSAIIATTIISMAHGLNLSVIAEGVEDQKQLQFMQEKNCEEVQGYFFSKPLPVEDFTKLLQNQESIKAACGLSSLTRHK